MLDINYIIQNKDKVQKSATQKKIKIDISKLINLHLEQKKITSESEKFKYQKNQITQNILNIKSSEKNNYIKKAQKIRKNIISLEKELKIIKEKFTNLMLNVPNILLDEVPIGNSDKDNIEWKKWGNIPKFDFNPKDHITLGKNLDIIDFDKGVQISGSKNYFLKNAATMLEIAIMQFALNSLIKKGFTIYTVPLMVKKEIMQGTGYFPGGEEQTYHINKDDLYLIGTSEVPLCAYYANTKLHEKNLPIKMASWSNCFRREAGTYGKDSQGLYRIHQFQKIEQVIIGINDPKTSKKLHFELLKNAEEMLQKMKLAYRVVKVCSGDLGMGQVIKHDIETWMPSRKNYGETHSCSSFYEFQSRRLNIKYKNYNKQNIYTHTLNNTCIASPRILIPILENYQQADGSILIPEVLKPYMHGLEKIKVKNK